MLQAPTLARLDYSVFKLSLDSKDIIECSTKIDFKYDRIVMSTIHVESIKHCWVDRGDDELSCII